MNEVAVESTPEQIEEQQRILRAIHGGMRYLLDEIVVAPTKHADGIVDLKWLLRKLLSGEWGLNMNPQQAEKLTTDQEPLPEPLSKESPQAVEVIPIAGVPIPNTSNGK